MTKLAQTQAAYLAHSSGPEVGPEEAGIEAMLEMQATEAELMAQFMHPHMFTDDATDVAF